MKETWKAIKHKGIDYTGVYEVSDFGNVRSLRYNKIKILKPCMSGPKYGKYSSINLRHKGLPYSVRVHTLVWNMFKYKRKDGFVVHHKDSNKLNNNLLNLDHISFRENNSKERTVKSGLPVGVWLSKGKYRSQIRLRGVIISLGTYNKVSAASNAYQIALKVIDDSLTTKNKLKQLVSNYRESINKKPLRY